MDCHTHKINKIKCPTKKMILHYMLTLYCQGDSRDVHARAQFAQSRHRHHPVHAGSAHGGCAQRDHEQTTPG